MARTGFNTRVVYFYRKTGWAEVGLHGSDEKKFEMSYEGWKNCIEKT